jgi:hypothetical protein
VKHVLLLVDEEQFCKVKKPQGVCDLEKLRFKFRFLFRRYISWLFRWIEGRNEREVINFSN